MYDNIFYVVLTLLKFSLERGNFMKEISCVNYLDFGAVGDGVTDDFEAICAAHEYANKNGLPVVIDDGRTYLLRNTLIGGEVRSVEIKTDVLWGSASFIIDDTALDYFDGTMMTRTPIFKIISDCEPIEITDRETLSSLGKIGEGATKLNIELGYPALLVVYNENHRVYHRYGASYISRGGQSSPQHEVLLVDGEGNIDVSTPFMFDYGELTKLTVIRADIRPIKIEGGIIITRAARKHPYDIKTGAAVPFLHRNILINRSNVTLDGVKHYVEGEVSLSDYAKDGLAGAHYWGFFCVSFANDVLLKNCVLTGRRSYRFSSYEFHADHVNKIRLEGCTQSNFTMEDEDGNTVFSMSPSKLTKWPHCWGIGGTNFCKNMEYLNCRLSRFDAHQGLYNGRITNSTINFMEIIGKGELVLENVEWNSPCSGRVYNSFAYLRDDFGCTWDGTVTFKDCTFNVSEGDAYVFFYSYTNWDYGYRCYFPNLVMDNPTINGLSEGAKLHIVNERGSVLREPQLHLPLTSKVPFKHHDGNDDQKDMTNANPVIPPSFIKVINNRGGYEFLLPKCAFFDETERLGVTDEELEVQTV